MNRRKTKAKRRRRSPHWSKRHLDNHYEEFRQRQRANWSELVPEITFVLLKCRAVYERAHIREIANEAVTTYPGTFETYFNGRKIPDYSLILLTLTQANKREWGFIAGNWFKGWKLTKKGAAFSRDVQRRRDMRVQQRLAA
jgi:hypothetical protein